MQEGEKGIKEEKIEVEWVEGKRWWRFNKILITLLVSGHSPLSFVPVHEKLNCRTWYPWKASPSKSVVIYERVQLINISGPAFNGLTLPTIKIVPNVPRLWLRSKGFCGCRTHFRSEFRHFSFWPELGSNDSFCHFSPFLFFTICSIAFFFKEKIREDVKWNLFFKFFKFFWIFKWI